MYLKVLSLTVCLNVVKPEKNGMDMIMMWYYINYCIVNNCFNMILVSISLWEFGDNVYLISALLYSNLWLYLTDFFSFGLAITTFFD